MNSIANSNSSSSVMTPSMTSFRKSRQNSTTSTTSSIFSHTDRSTTITNLSKAGTSKGLEGEDLVSESDRGSEVGSVASGSGRSWKGGNGLRKPDEKSKKSGNSENNLNEGKGRLSTGPNLARASTGSNSSIGSASSSSGKFGFQQNSAKSKLPGNGGAAVGSKTSPNTRSSSPLRTGDNSRRSESLERSNAGKTILSFGSAASRIDASSAKEGPNVVEEIKEKPLVTRPRTYSTRPPPSSFRMNSISFTALATTPTSTNPVNSRSTGDEEVEEIVDEWGRTPTKQYRSNSLVKPLTLPSSIGRLSGVGVPTSTGGNRDSLVGANTSVGGAARPRFPLPYNNKRRELSLSLSAERGGLLPGLRKS
jgi:hypothetical protein